MISICSSMNIARIIRKSNFTEKLLTLELQNSAEIKLEYCMWISFMLLSMFFASFEKYKPDDIMSH